MTSNHTHNFNAGPAVLPPAVLEQAQAELLNYAGSGMSILEMSHRGAHFEAIVQPAEANLRALLGIPDNYRVIFLQGGATLQFAMLPMNLLPSGASADYTLTGAWAKAAIKEAEKLGRVRVAATTEPSGFDRVPSQGDLDLDPGTAYLHFTSNETIHGVEWPVEPEPPPNVPLVCDMSSDIASRPLDVRKYGLIYAGAQKNLGPAGVTIVIVRDDLLARVPPRLPVMLDYRAMADHSSVYNTPPAFAIYVVGLVLRWLTETGGLDEIARRNQAKASLLYRAIDDSGGFYRGCARPDSRSRMNVTIRLPSEELESRFVKQSAAQGFVGLKGHRSVGGLRASLYNALPLTAVEALSQFMAEFLRVNG